MYYIVVTRKKVQLLFSRSPMLIPLSSSCRVPETIHREIHAHTHSGVFALYAHEPLPDVWASPL
jgi:hypothetical protein